MDLGITILDHAVFQRTQNNCSSHPFRGSCAVDGPVLMTVRSDNGILSAWKNVPVGFARQGQLQGNIEGLPAGGPYELTLAIENSREKVSFHDIYVGDVWILAGQSNMAGFAFMPSMSTPHPAVKCFYMNNRWRVAEDPLHDVMRAAAPVHGGDPSLPRPKKFLRGPGPGLPFALAMYEKTQVPQGVIACAHGGTSMSQWDPDKKSQGDYSLYGALYNRLQNLGGKVAGVIWFQGSNETGSEMLADAYENNMRKLFKALRRDCRNHHLPIVFAQMGPYISRFGEDRPTADLWFKVRCMQYKLGQTVRNTACVPAIDSSMDDHIHISTEAVTRLGRRMADAMEHLIYGKGLPQIKPRRAVCRANAASRYADVTVTFDHVQGNLTSEGAPCGFAVLDMDDNYICEAIKVKLDGNKAHVFTRVPNLGFAGQWKIAYGAGYQEYANITDSAGRSLPCCTVTVKDNEQNISAMLNNALVSEPFLAPDTYDRLTMPENLDRIKFTRADFHGFYQPVPRISGEWDNQSRVYYYKFRLDLSEAMKLEMLFGSDAPFALYRNGVEFAREHTCNPVDPDEFRYPMHLTAGRHDFVCVFSANGGQGWGICCRFKRKDGKKTPEFAEIEL